MSTNSEQILQQAMALSPRDRAEVVERLLASFQLPPDPELEQLWAREAEDRIDAYERGEIGTIPADEVYARIERERPK
jgi:putative addiction module component (TIGR02574 family)